MWGGCKAGQTDRLKRHKTVLQFAKLPSFWLDHSPQLTVNELLSPVIEKLHVHSSLVKLFPTYKNPFSIIYLYILNCGAGTVRKRSDSGHIKKAASFYPSLAISPLNSQVGGTAMAQLNLSRRVFEKIFSMGTSFLLHQATEMRGSM